MTAQAEELTSPKASALQRKGHSILKNTRTSAETMMRFVRSMHEQTKKHKQCDKGLYMYVS